MNTSILDQTTTPIFDVAIIGAGLSGSLCAHLLAQSGQSVCVIEKSRGSGGRAGSKRLENEISCDLGTPYILAKHPDTLALFQPLTQDHIIAPWQQGNDQEGKAFVGVPKMSTLTRHWLEAATLVTNTRIHHLDQLNNDSEQPTWLLRDDKYKPVVIAKSLIIATPAQQAASLLATHDKLAVPLLRANRACENYESQWAMWLETEPCDLGALIEPKGSPIKRMIKDNHKPMRPLENVDRWVIQTDPSWTKQHLDTYKGWIADALLQAFSEITEHRVLKHGDPHRWFLSRFTEHKANRPFVWSPEHQVGLIGDWLCQGDAEGALLSAMSLTKHLKDLKDLY